MQKLKILPFFISSFHRKMSTEVLKEIFRKSIESVQPQNLIRTKIQLHNGHLSICGETHQIRKPCHLVGFGKAVLGMALEMEHILKDNLQMGLVSIPKGSLKSAPKSKIRFIEAAPDNIPDEAALTAAKEIKQLAEGLNEEDLLLVLISGGGSALLPYPRSPITLGEKQDLIRDLSRKGANIVELNCVRQGISVLKGGGLAELAYPAKVVALVLSDIVDDPLEFIASGPTVPPTHLEALEVLAKYNCRVSKSVKSVLMEKREIRAPVKGGKYEHVDNYVVGNNRIAVEAAYKAAASLNLQSAILSSSVVGDVGKIGEIYAKMASAICNSSVGELQDVVSKWGFGDEKFVELLGSFDLNRDVCLIAGGETTVVVKGKGRGGRNQQLALELSVRLNKLNIKSADISFLSGGTDGIDGPTDAAGAIGTSDLVNNCLAQNIKAEDYLNNNDSYGFFSLYNDGDNLIKIGHTGTNVMDIHVMFIKRKK